ncbi:DUF2809 domain-containing protein [Cellulomonas xiejunii]|uniref:DUF2809 domain-containing protein n=1 Tax=Cellulomonas xiejunii TaxID=2968083 RepID=A0ABY5KV23_9CELL|nr:DUF2809 domain-containing protein [Cellulomonas xiejunii]MCC2314801.1 DUF2809 domain-containing protein [Cellulomonas xiejunii]MCC2323083.1 DUF2809 domain-containing protein [Cellulomonas xiejunii]UUI73575.1 DUF2809 domain-containing protein [Cellulomonas xiejunii]
MTTPLPTAPPRAPRAARRRAPLAVAAVVVVLLGLTVSRGDDLLADLAGGALYAALVQLLVLLVVPTVRTGPAAATALGVCVAVELAQLTPVPVAVVAAWPPAAYVLGSTFVATDLLAYAAGVVVVTAGDALLRHRGTATR